MRKETNGFTLIEILVVISIISILGTIGFAIFSNALKGNRDQQRYRDLQAIKQALELYRNDFHVYPVVSSDGYKPANLIPKYLAAWPADPNSNWQYVYSAYTSSGLVCNTTSNCARFVVCAKKESNASFGNTPTDCQTLKCSKTLTTLTCDMGLASD